MFQEATKTRVVLRRKYASAHGLLLGCALAAAVGCKGTPAPAGNAGDACASDADCKNGLHCQASLCVVGAVTPAPGAGAATPAAATNPAPVPPAPADSAKENAAHDAGAEDAGSAAALVPEIPTTKSKPPQGTEWDEGVKVNTQNIHSQPDDCELRVLREWLNVACQGKIVSYEKMANFGAKNVDYFESVILGSRASFVFRMKPGNPQSLRICREKDRASLLVNWPTSKDRPVHIALGKGPKCEEEDADEAGKHGADKGAAGKTGAADKDAKKKSADKQPKKG